MCFMFFKLNPNMAIYLCLYLVYVLHLIEGDHAPVDDCDDLKVARAISDGYSGGN